MTASEVQQQPAPTVLSLPLKAGAAASHAFTSAMAQHPPAAVTGKVSMVAVLSILDHWIHRDPESQRVVGALVGHRSDDGSSMEITDAFPIVLLDNDSSIDMDFAATMYQLRRRTNPKELVLGWYSTGYELDPSSEALHEWFEANLVTPAPFQHGIHVLVDTSLEYDEMPLQGFIGVPVSSLNQGNQGRMFVPFPIKIEPAEHELPGLELIATAAHPQKENKALIHQDVGIPDATERIDQLAGAIDAAIEYVNNVIDTLKTKQPMSGEQAHHMNQLGHALARIIATKTDARDVARMDTEIRDLKTIAELVAQARKQLQVSELIQYGSAYQYGSQFKH